MNTEVQHVERYTWRGDSRVAEPDTVVTETPVALVYNGISHVVTMATPSHLAEMALGFSLSEGILETPAQLLDSELVQQEQGMEVRLTVTAQAFDRLKRRRRNMTGRTGCGLCGVESLEQAIPETFQITQEWGVSHRAIRAAVQSLEASQKIKRETGGVHAAAWCSLTGEIEILREDVGRHNALDKILGALHGKPCSAQGFVLITSRASYEMVAKVASQNIPVLVAVSAPTSLAIGQAKEAGLTLVAYAQPERQVVFTHPERLSEELKP